MAISGPRNQWATPAFQTTDAAPPRHQANSQSLPPSSQSNFRAKIPPSVNQARQGAARFNTYIRSQAYSPIQSKTYADYGNASKPAVQSTDFGRQIAERAIGEDGKLNFPAIQGMIKQLEQDQTLPKSYRKHALATLRELRDPRLQNIIHQTCVSAPPRGAAADIVRSTLNLPPEHQHITQADVRRAMLTAMMGQLRQGKVGSCFATGPAICVSTGPRTLQASQLKQLLEQNKLTMHGKNGAFDVPLNKRLSRAEAQVPLKIYNGMCYGKASNNEVGTGYALHETPNMQAALNALGIPPHLQGQYVADAMARVSTPVNNGWRNVTEQKIIESLAHSTPSSNGRAPHHRIATALSAHSSAESPALMRAWEYTLASSSEIDDNGAHIQAISDTVIFGKAIPGRPDLKSLSAASVGVVQQMKNVGWNPQHVDHLNQQLHNNVVATMKQYWCQQYDADMAQPGVSADGVSNRGGFTLFEKIPLNDPSQWKRIDPNNPAQFQAAMQRVIDHASNQTAVQMQSMGRNPQHDRQALSQIAQGLKGHVAGPGFINHAVVSMNPHLANQPSTDLSKVANLPWKQARGSGFTVVENLGGKMSFADDIQGAAQVRNSAATAGPVRAQGYPGDAAPMIDVVFERISGMKDQLRQAAVQEPNIKLPAGCLMKNGGHAMALNATTVSGMWDGRYASTPQFIEAELRQPTARHMHSTRTEPALYPMLCNLGKSAGIPQAAIDQMFWNVATPSQGGQPPQYSLAKLHEHLSVYAGKNTAMQAQIGRTLEQAAPSPVVAMFDMNWVNEKNGEPKALGVSYNPYTGAVNAHQMDEDGSNRMPAGDDWLTGKWGISTPLSSRA